MCASPSQPFWSHSVSLHLSASPKRLAQRRPRTSPTRNDRAEPVKEKMMRPNEPQRSRAFAAEQETPPDPLECDQPGADWKQHNDENLDEALRETFPPAIR